MASSHTLSAWGVLAAIVLATAPDSRAANFAGGTGEPSDPYQIATAQQLVSFGSDPNLLDKHFVLIADIDLDPNLPGGRVFPQAVIAADVFRAVGKKTVVDSLAFTGTFDGNSHTVKNVVIKDARTRCVGLFGTIGTSGRVEDLGVGSSTTEGSYWVGGLAGHNGGTILRCYVLGQVIASQYSGGLVGRNRGVIAMSHATGAVLGGNKSEALGGLAGQNGDGGTITNCCSDATVSLGHSSDYLGALVGDNIGSISSCYATGVLSVGDSSMFVGGLAGYNTGSIANCYTTAVVLSGQACTAVGGGQCPQRRQLRHGWFRRQQRGRYYSLFCHRECLRREQSAKSRWPGGVQHASGPRHEQLRTR
jgi:hypothetical protein